MGNFASLLSRLIAQEELDALIGEWTGQQSAHDLMRRLQEAGVPAGVVYKGEGLAWCCHLRERDFYQETVYYGADPKVPATDWPESDRVLAAPVPISSSKSPLSLGKVRRVGQDNENVYCDLIGMTRAELDRLVEDHVVY